MRVEFNAEGDLKPQIGVYSFGSKSGVRLKSQFEFDVSKLRDPQGQKQFNNAYGWQPDVRDWVKSDPRIASIVADCRMMAEDLLKARVKHDSSPGTLSEWTSFAFKDFHGKWTSPAVAELVADALSADGWRVAVYHSEHATLHRKETTLGGRLR